MKIANVATTVLGLIASAALLAGCANPDFKSTPYYTDDAGFNKGSEEDRVPLWPLVYYKNPALSVLWPFIEKTDEYFAIRPLMSAYSGVGEKDVYSFLWPIASFDGRSGENRVFPIFWGKDYFTAFPLYWHFGHPTGLDGGSDSFIPLWYYSKDRAGSDTYLFWPLIHLKNKGIQKGWHVWPLLGHYWNGINSYWFALWPFGHEWSNSAGRSGGALIPLCWYDADPHGSLFISLVFSRGVDVAAKSAWNLVLPLYYRSTDKHSDAFFSIPWSSVKNNDGAAWQLLPPLFFAAQDGTNEQWIATLLGGYHKWTGGMGWLALPILSGGSSSEYGSDAWIVGPLAHFGSTRDSSNQHVFPLYYRNEDRNGSLFVSLPWSAGSSTDGSSWQLVPPLFYAGQNGQDDRMVATLLGGYHRQAGGVSWAAVPVLSYGSIGKDSSEVWVGGPLAHFKFADESSSQHVFPLYYRSAGRNGSLFLSLPWSSGSYADGSAWRLIPPVFYQTQDREGSALITPLYARGENKSNGTRWNTVIPLYYWTAAGNSSTIATLLGGVRNDDDGRHWLIYPLLSGGRRDKYSGDIWLAAPIFHAGWDKSGSSQHLLPLYYWNSEDQTFLSPLAATWREAVSGNRITAVPPLLSWLESDGRTKDLWLAAGLAHMSWGEKPGSQHVLPLFYRDATTGTFISPLAAKWLADDGATRYMFPSALSWLTRTPDRNDLWVVGPMAHWSWGQNPGSRHVLPLFYSDTRSGTFVSPVAAKWGGEGVTNYMFPPALSWLTKTPERNDLWMVGPMAHWSWGPRAGSRHVFPLFYSDSAAETFLSPVAAKWRGDDGAMRYLFPPAVSWLTKSKDSSDLWLLGGLAHWGQGTQHVFPLFYNDSSEGTFMSIPVCTWKDSAKSRTWLYPPLLSAYMSDGENKDIYAALGLFHQAWGKAGTDGYLLPLYLCGDRSFYSPIVGWDRSGRNGFVYPLTPLAGLLTGEDRSGGWLFPLFWHERDKKTANYEGRFLLWGRYEGSSVFGESAFFPFWNYSRDSAPDNGAVNTRGSVLFWLYDYIRTVKPGDQTTAVDYTRKRILWRFWRYERTNGDVSMDVFPAITYDSRPDGFKKTSFLWRLFRYERSSNETKLDLLFVPIMRSHSADAGKVDSRTNTER